MIQIDMDIPKNCSNCPFCDSNNCFVTGNNVESEYIADVKPNDCPLKEIKHIFDESEIATIRIFTAIGISIIIIIIAFFMVLPFI